MNPYGGPKPHKLRNPKLVILVNLKNGRQRHVHCFKFDVMKNEKGQISDYACTSKEHGDYFTVTVFPARSWCSKEEWEKRPKVPRVEKAETVEAKPVEPPTSPVSESVPVSPPVSAAPDAAPSKLTFTVLVDGDEEEVTPDEIAAMNRPAASRIAPVSLDAELPNEYNPRAKVHTEKKFALGTPEDLVNFEKHVATSIIEQEAQRKIQQMRHRREMQDSLLVNRAGFMPDNG